MSALRSPTAPPPQHRAYHHLTIILCQGKHHLTPRHIHYASYHRHRRTVSLIFPENIFSVHNQLVSSFATTALRTNPGKSHPLDDVIYPLQIALKKKPFRIIYASGVSAVAFFRKFCCRCRHHLCSMPPTRTDGPSHPLWLTRPPVDVTASTATNISTHYHNVIIRHTYLGRGVVCHDPTEAQSLSWRLRGTDQT